MMDDDDAHHFSPMHEQVSGNHTALIYTHTMKTTIIWLVTLLAPIGSSHAFVSPSSAVHDRPVSTILKASHRPDTFFQNAVSTLLLSLVVLSSSSSSLPAVAADYNSLTAEQKSVAEAWRLVDNSFLDRTFGHQEDWFQLRQDAVHRKYKSTTQAQEAISEMLQSLGDPYTKYLPPQKYQSIVDTATGTLAGVGIEISTNSLGNVICSDVEANSPAALAGIQPDDVFVEVDGTRFEDNKSTPDDVAVQLRGPKGSKVGVVMERNGKTLDYILTREPIKITSVKSYLSNVGGNGVGKVGVVRIKSFSATTAETVKSALAELKKKGAQAFLIDVRGNPGGLLPGGVDTASLFLEANKPVVFVVDKKGIVDSQATFVDGIDTSSPLVVLVDGKTASAAEVFAAALKENGRATIAGEQTFGKGIIQTIRELSNDNGGVAITVARYETPNHNDINKQGVPVNVKTSVECPKTDATACVPPSAFQKPITAA
jgi:carboxyl-terminal processing protease